MELQLLGMTNLLTLVLILVIVPKILEVCLVLVWRPLALTRRFKKQGVSGPKYKFFYGNLQEIKKMKAEAKLRVLDPNSNDIFPHVSPHFHQWVSQYGDVFVYWRGTEAKLCISDPELAKKILSNKLDFSGIPKKSRSPLFKLFGKGLAFTEGQDWTRHRKIFNPAFSMDSVKVMTKVMVNCSLKMLEEWRKHEKDGEMEKLGVVKMEVYKEFQRVTTEMIAAIMFGNNSEEGIEMFRTQTEILKHFVDSGTTVFIPGAQYFPTPANLITWKLDKKMKNSIKGIIDERLKLKSKKLDSDYGDDLLGVMLRSGKLSIDEILDECKTFFFSGYGTTSLLLTWTMLLLSLHQNWQEKLREEVFRECGKDKIPDSDTFSKLKMMNMVLLETLRLYSPVIKLFRETTKDTKIGHVEIPKGTGIFILIPKIHSDKAIWGDDGDKFNPMRFENGVSVAAKHPNAFLAFSAGPRACIGQNFAMIEVKIVVTMILQRFRFSLSSEYVHAPVDHLDLHPRYGLPLMIQPLNK